MSKLTLLIIIATAVVVVLLFMSPARSASTNPCSQCHGPQGYSQTLSFLAGNSGNQIPSTINVGETVTVTVVLQNKVNAPLNTALSGVSATLKSQNGHFSVSAPIYSIGNFPSGTATATWQITGVSAGADALLMKVTATNSHMNLQFADTYAPSPSVNVQAPAPTPPPPTPTPPPSSVAPSASPMSTPTPTATSSPTSSPGSSTPPNPTATPPYNPTPTPTLNPGQTPPPGPPQTSSPNLQGTPFPSAMPSSSPSPQPTYTPSSSPAPSLPVSISLLSPSGGESWWSGTQHAITWSVTGGSGSATVDIEYSHSGMQGPWLTIASDLSNVTSFVWKVPDVRSSDCYIRASVNDSSNPTQMVSTVSAYAYSIAGADQNLPNVAAAIALMVPVASVVAFFFGLQAAKRKPLRRTANQAENAQQ